MLAIAGGKGGCGKTTTTCAIAATLANRGRSPVVVDADVAMPDLARRVRAGDGPGIDALAAGRPVRTVVRTDHDLPGVGVVHSGAPESLPPALAALRGHTEPVLVDCPAGAGPDVTAALSGCDRTLVVTTDTRPSLTDATKTVAMARELDASVAGLALRETDHGPGHIDDATARLRQRLAVPWVVPIDRGSESEATPGARRLTRSLFDSPAAPQRGPSPGRAHPTTGRPGSD